MANCLYIALVAHHLGNRAAVKEKEILILPGGSGYRGYSLFIHARSFPALFSLLSHSHIPDLVKLIAGDFYTVTICGRIGTRSVQLIGLTDHKDPLKTMPLLERAMHYGKSDMMVDVSDITGDGEGIAVIDSKYMRWYYSISDYNLVALTETALLRALYISGHIRYNAVRIAKEWG